MVYWQVATGRPLFFVTWPADDAVVVYQPASGDTHLVSAMGAALLESLQTLPATEEALFKYLVPDEELSPLVVHKLRRKFLIHFEQIGLIEKSHP